VEEDGMMLVWQSVPWYEILWRATVRETRRKIDPIIFAAWEYFFDE
jgi:hypothetical protein